MTSDQRVQMHYDEAVLCLNAIGKQTDVEVADIVTPRLIGAAIAHALLGLLADRKRSDGAL